jgi:hypothetical protein
MTVYVIETTSQLMSEQGSQYEHYQIEERFGYFWTRRGAAKMAAQLNLRVQECWNTYQRETLTIWKARRREGAVEPLVVMDWSDWMVYSMEAEYSVKELHRV